MTRKEKDAERKRLRRANETAEEREIRNEKKRLDARRKRSSESSDASLERLTKQRSIDKSRRANETVEQHRSRLDQQNAMNIARRSNETGEQHQARLDKQREIDAIRRSNETTEETNARIRNVSRRRQQRMADMRNNPPAKTWPKPISQEVKDRCLSEFNKRMSMNYLREEVCVVCNSRHYKTEMHEVQLSDIDETLLKPHHTLNSIIPGTQTANFKEQDLNIETLAHREQSKSQYLISLYKSFQYLIDQKNSCINNTSYLMSNGRILYREGLLNSDSETDVDCRMCHECWLAISKGKISKYSPANGMWIGDVPNELRGLTIPEQKLISLYRHNSCIIKLHSPWHSPSTAQPALKGNCITFPQNVSNIATSLPLAPNELAESIKIIFIGASKPSRHHLRKVLTVRRQRIVDALNWLKKNNTLYSHITLDKHTIAALPDNDIPESLWETFDHVEDTTSANAEREGYTEDPLNSEEAIDEETSCNFVPMNPSGVLDVNGASVSAEELNNEMCRKLQIGSDQQLSSSSETNTVSRDFSISFMNHVSICAHIFRMMTLCT